MTVWQCIRAGRSVWLFEDAIDFPLAWSEEAGAYRSQHTTLYLDVCDMVDAAERLLYHEANGASAAVLQRVQVAFNCFYRRLQLHDAGENALMESVLHWQRTASQAEPMTA